MNADSHSDVTSVIKTLTGVAPLRVTQIKGGMNNLCFKVESETGVVLAKKYFRHQKDKRDRLNSEFSMLSFLWNNGMRCVPEPLARDDVAGVGLYRFVEGVVPESCEITREDVKRMSELLAGMWALKNESGAQNLPAAADAAFKLKDYTDCITARLDTVLSCAESNKTHKHFPVFVTTRLVPAFEKLMVWFHEQTEGMDTSVALPLEARTLSPADHGFHNSIRCSDGSLVFIDFEYSGWDDPAQMICNARLQPQVPVPSGLAGFLLDTLFEKCAFEKSLASRLEIVYPLLAFKWCLIMLNEFLPVSDERRRFAGTDPESRKTVQLRKAGCRLEKIEVFLERGAVANKCSVD